MLARIVNIVYYSNKGSSVHDLYTMILSEPVATYLTRMKWLFMQKAGSFINPMVKWSIHPLPYQKMHIKVPLWLDLKILYYLDSAFF